MSCCELGNGWVGGWVGYLPVGGEGRVPGAGAFHPAEVGCDEWVGG